MATTTESDGPGDLSAMASTLSAACDVELAEHGDDARGAGYVRGDGAARTCYEVMLGLLRPSDRAVSVLDFGCGTGGLLGYLQATGRDQDVVYTGLDLSREAIALARHKFPAAEFLQLDVLGDDHELGTYDYVLMNGVFHWRGEASIEEMREYWRTLLRTVYAHARIGLAFNAMSLHVDWEREDLFHLPFDEMAAFATAEISRHLAIRADYGVYEYTAYLYREPFAA